MTLEDGIILVLIAVILGLAIWYIRRQKKRGMCVGCSCGKECAAKRAGQGCCSQKK